MGNLTNRDEKRFAELRDRLEGVARHDPDPEPLETAPGPIDPMLATTYDGELSDLATDEWVAEQKFDGTRLLLEKFDGDVALYTRRHVERSETLPDLAAVAAETLPDGVVLDGEYTFLDADGDSRFVPIHASDDRLESRDLTPRYLVFDVLVVDHEWVTGEPLEDRTERLAGLVPDREGLARVDAAEGDIQAFYEEIVGQGEEGIVLKRRGSAYHIGTRSDHWRKVKAVTEGDFLAVGYTPGEGRRAETFGALVLTDGERYVGRVGSGFDETELEALVDAMEPVEDRPVPPSTVGSDYVPVVPFVVEVEYLEVTDDGELRAPVFVRERPGKPVGDVPPL